jgi:hypothetical protein
MPTVSELALAEDTILSAVILLTFGYTSYKAFEIRKSLGVGLYRRQALWIGAISGLYTLLLFETFLFTFVFTTSSGVIDLAVSLSQDAGIIAIFAWVDTSTRIARRSDPLLRDSLSWTKVRLPLWILLAGSLASTYYFAIGVVYSGGSLNSSPSTPLLASLATFLFTPFVAGSFIIPVSAARSGDPILRGHFKWFGVFLVILISTVVIAVGTIIEGSTTGYLDITRKLLQDPLSAIGFFILVFLGGYCGYRSARSLAPLNRVSLDWELHQRIPETST